MCCLIEAERVFLSIPYNDELVSTAIDGYNLCGDNGRNGTGTYDAACLKYSSDPACLYF